jgi:hypothetical protein
MNLKGLVFCCCFVLASLVNLQPASAARIYNFLEQYVIVKIVGGFGLVPSDLTLQPGTRSDSLSWSNVTAIKVQYQNRDVCYFNWWIHAEIQGGNYLVISQAGRDVNCNLCNASHELVQRSSGRLPEDVREYYSPYQMC